MEVFVSLRPSSPMMLFIFGSKFQAFLFQKILKSSMNKAQSQIKNF